MLMIGFNRSSFKFSKIKSKLEISKLLKLDLVLLLVLFIKVQSLLQTVVTLKDSLSSKISKV